MSYYRTEPTHRSIVTCPTQILTSMTMNTLSKLLPTHISRTETTFSWLSESKYTYFPQCSHWKALFGHFVIKLDLFQRYNLLCCCNTISIVVESFVRRVISETRHTCDGCRYRFKDMTHLNLLLSTRLHRFLHLFSQVVRNSHRLIDIQK